MFRHLWRWQAPARLDRLALRTNAVLDLTTVQKSGSGYVADARETAAAAAAGEFEASKKRKRLLSAESWHQLSFLNMTISHKKKKKKLELQSAVRAECVCVQSLTRCLDGGQ